MSIQFNGKTIAGNFGYVMDVQLYNAKLQSDGRTYVVEKDMDFPDNSVHLIHFDKANSTSKVMLKFGTVSTGGLLNNWELLSNSGDTLKTAYIVEDSIAMIVRVNNETNVRMLQAPKDIMPNDSVQLHEQIPDVSEMENNMIIFVKDGEINE